MQKNTELRVYFSATPFTVGTVPTVATPSTYPVLSIEKHVGRDTFTTFSISIVWPGPEFWSNGTRYVAVRSSDGADGVGGILGLGEISGFPIGLAGAEVLIDVVCRAADHDYRVTSALSPVRERLTSHFETDDNDQILDLALTSIFVDPVYHTVSLTPFGGVRETGLREFYGEGSAIGQNNIISMTPTVVSTPSEEFILTANARHTQFYTNVVTKDIPTFSYYGELNDGYSGGEDVNNILGVNAITMMDGSFTATLRAKYIDPTSCLEIPAVTQQIDKKRVAGGDVRAAVSTQVVRDEFAQFRVKTNIGPAPGSKALTRSEIGVSEMDGVNWFDQIFNQSRPGGIKAIRVRCTRASAFLDNTAISSKSADVVNALVEIAARQALDNIYCIEIIVETTVQSAENLDSRMRGRIRDVRLPRGYAVGWVTSVRLRYGDSDSATVTLLCPLVGPEPVTSGTDVTSSLGAAAGSISVYRTLGAPAGYAPSKPGILAALEAGDGDYFIEGIEVKNDASVQQSVLDELNNTNSQQTLADEMTRDPYALRYAIDDITDHLPETSLTVSFAQRLLGEEAVDNVEIGKIWIRILGGITFG